jgi:hypothetical protein
MLRYKHCPLVLIFVLGLFLGSCAQPGGPAAAGLNPNQTNDGDTQPDGSSTENGSNQTNDGNTQPGKTPANNDGSEYPEGWEDWEEDQEEPPVVTGIEIASLPDITIYPQSFTENDLDFAGLVVYKVWDNGQTTELKSRVVLSEGYQTDPSGYTIDTKNIKATPGWSVPCTVYIRWGSFPAAEFSVVVDESNRVLQSVAASGSLPASQELGRAFQFGSLKITGTYKEDEVTTTALIDPKAYKVTGYDMRKRGDQTVSIRVNGKQVGAYNITVKVPAGAAVKAPGIPDKYIPGRTTAYKPVYLKGQEFSLATAGITVTVTANGQTLVLSYGDGGFTGADLADPEGVLDSGGRFVKAGRQNFKLKLDNAPSVDIPFFVIGEEQGVQPRVYFDYGYRQTADDTVGAGPGDGKYYVKSGSYIVLAPVRYLIGYRADHTIDPNIAYSWTVDGGGYDTGVSHHGETFTFKPSATTFPAVYTVSVSVTGHNFITGLSDTKTAVTEVVCYSGTTTGAKTFQSPLKDFAPGQFTEQGTGHGWSLGAVLGYQVWDAAKNGSAITSTKITGNAFSSWSEPGIVWVQPDDNGNGIPDETWYELLGSSGNKVTRRYALSYIRDEQSAQAEENEFGQIIRTIYWTDQRGRVGIIPGGWPTVGDDKGIHGVAGNWVVFTGTLLAAADGLNLNVSSSSSLNTGSVPAARAAGGGPGYVDAYGGYDIFYASDAVHADGTPAGLTGFRFVKVHTGIFEYGDAFGDRSTEIVSY